MEEMQVIDGELYKCQIKDREGNVEEFVAHGLDEVTGPLKNPLMTLKLKMMFPTFA